MSKTIWTTPTPPPRSRFVPLSAVVMTVATCMILGTFAGAQESDPAPADAPADAESAFEGEYAPIVRNNIFVRDRRPYVPPATRPTSRPAPVPLDPRKEYQLVGIVFERDLFGAYFTSLKGGPTTRAAPGDPLAGGVVAEVLIDAVRFVSADGVAGWVDIGQDLTGAVPSGARPAATAGADAAPAEGEAADAPAAPAGGGEMSLEERMRQRRQGGRGGR